MTGEPKLPHKPKRGDRTAAGADEAECLAGIGVAGYTGPKDAAIAEVHESVADGAGAWSAPGDPYGAGSGDVSMKRPGAGAYYRYIKLKDIVHEEN